MRNTNCLIIIFALLTSLNSWAGCEQFETALEKALAKVTARQEAKSQKTAWASKEAEDYKALYGANKSDESGNRHFISLVDADKASHADDVLYFSSENSIQKLLNDKIIVDKGMVDAINNSFYGKLDKNLKDFPELSALLKGKASGFKSKDMRLRLTRQDNKELLEKQLNELYKKTNAEFVEEFEKKGLTKLLPPRTDNVSDPSSWFLAGTGDSALQANQAARWARKMNFSNGNAKAMSYREIVEKIHEEVTALEGFRKKLSNNAELLKAGIMHKLPSGEVIPSREMIDILRRTKLSDCNGMDDFLMKFRAKVETQFNTKISKDDIDDLVEYFNKVDFLSPPIYERARVVINLGNAKDDIISVDFTGIGVDNAEAQMRALANVDFNQKDKGKLMSDAYGKVEAAVDEVTKEMNEAKRFFSSASKDPSHPENAPQFSGDDGIFMPTYEWTTKRKIELVKFLGKFRDPSKFRLTTGKTTDAKGRVIPVGQRSPRIVNAEKIEKDLREDVVGALKIPSARAKQMIFAIDYKGGRYNLILGGQRPTPTERAMIIESFTKAVKAKEGQGVGDIIEAFN